MGLGILELQFHQKQIVMLLTPSIRLNLFGGRKCTRHSKLSKFDENICLWSCSTFED